MDQVRLTIAISRHELDEIGALAAMDEVSIEVWLARTALREAWRVMHQVEWIWVYRVEKDPSSRRLLEIHLSQAAFDALADVAAGTFYWNGTGHVRVDVPSFVGDAACREVARTMPARCLP